jgi:hypothetical protein
MSGQLKTTQLTRRSAGRKLRLARSCLATKALFIVALKAPRLPWLWISRAPSSPREWRNQSSAGGSPQHAVGRGLRSLEKTLFLDHSLIKEQAA